MNASRLASLEFLRGQHQRVELASYNDRKPAAARAMGTPVAAA